MKLESLTILFLLLAASYLFGRFAEKVRLPKVMGPIVIGIICSIFFKEVFEQTDILKSFADLGLVFLMFFVGLELDLKNGLRRPAKIVLVSIFNIAIPFSVTFIIMKLMGFDTLVSCLLGVIMSITAEAISIEILQEFNVLKTKLAQTLILSATFDDVFGIVFLSGLVTYIEKGTNSFLLVFFNILIFFTVLYAARYLLIPYVLEFCDRDAKSQLLIAGTLMVLLVAVISEYLGLGSLLGALLAGVIVRYTFVESRQRKEMSEMFEAVTFGLLAPFFFIWVGFNTDFFAIIQAPAMGLMLLGLAILTKILGSLVGYYLAHGKFGEGMVLGVAMVNKGVIVLVLAEVAWSAGLIGPEMFTSIVFMAVITTIIGPIAFSSLIKRISIS